MQKQYILNSLLFVAIFIMFTSTANALADRELNNASNTSNTDMQVLEIKVEPVNQVAPSKPKVLPLLDTADIEHNDIKIDPGEGNGPVSGYVKLDGIDGESEDKKSTKRLLWGNDQGPSIAAETSKAKEIVVVGSKTKDENALKGKKILENFAPAEPILDSDSLREYAEGISVVDQNIKKVQINNEEIKLDYKQPAKLFGFIPIKMTISSSVNKNGSVKVKFPWYSFLTGHSLGDLKLKIEEAISEMNKAELVGAIVSEAEDKDSDDDSLTDLDEIAELNEKAAVDLQNAMQQQQQVLQTMSNIMKTTHDAAMGIIRNLK